MNTLRLSLARLEGGVEKGGGEGGGGVTVRAIEKIRTQCAMLEAVVLAGKRAGDC